MALTDAQKASVRFYLGYQDQFRNMNTALESQLSAGLSSDAETLVIATLANLAAVDAQLLTAHGRLKAMKVGSITLTGDGEVMALRSQGRLYVGRLAAMYGVQPLNDVYAEAAGAGGASSMGGVIPLG
jgi:hypothetical protein